MNYGQNRQVGVFLVVYQVWRPFRDFRLIFVSYASM